jgi:membrane protease YdiL (CAAX protease family)
MNDPTREATATNAGGSRPLPLRPAELFWLVGPMIGLNTLACRVAIPGLAASGRWPIEAVYFLSVGLLSLAPMFFLSLYLVRREIGTSGWPAVRTRLRVEPIRGRDWLWTVATFVGLSAASFVIADKAMPRLGMDATPFFFQNMPLGPGQRWILALWPAFFFFNIFGEEFFWRGYLLPRQELWTGRWTWLVQGLLWATWHVPMGLDLVVASMPIFFILPAVAQVRKNTTIAIVVHAVFGAFGFLALALGLLH